MSARDRRYYLIRDRFVQVCPIEDAVQHSALQAHGFRYLGDVYAGSGTLGHPIYMTLVSLPAGSYCLVDDATYPYGFRALPLGQDLTVPLTAVLR